MKKIKLLLGALVITVSLVGSTTIFAADIEDGTDGEVKFTPGILTLDPKPEDPDNPDLSKILPKNINFGSHEIQSSKAERWYATTEAGNGLYGDGSTLTKGGIVISDNRGGAEDEWELSVQQNEQFKIPENNVNLENALLKIRMLALVNNLGKTPALQSVKNEQFDEDGKDYQTLEFNNHSAITLIKGSKENAAGETILPLEVFELAIPAATEKQAGTYTSRLTWILTDGTTP